VCLAFGEIIGVFVVDKAIETIFFVCMISFGIACYLFLKRRYFCAIDCLVSIVCLPTCVCYGLVLYIL